MGYSIKDRLDFQLQIGGRTVELEKNMFDFFHVVESVRLYVPMMTLRMKDITKFFTRTDILTDGAPIVASISVQGKKIIYPFRLFSHKSVLENGVENHTLHAYLDVPRYWTESTNLPIKETASNALQKLCGECGMTYEGATTNDQQIWMPQNRRRAEFAKHIVRHAYIDESSCCQMAVLTDKRMRMLNISDFSRFQVKQRFSNVQAKEVAVITDYNVLNKSGFYNAVTGYKDKQIQQSFLEQDKETKDLNVKKNTKKLSVNSAVQTGVTQNRVSYTPVDVGNVNPNYERAKYQNQRLANLLTFGLEFVTPQLVEADLLDVINCDVAVPGSSSVTSLSGAYMVTSKVVYIENMNFYQKVEVFRQGLNSAKDKTQV